MVVSIYCVVFSGSFGVCVVSMVVRSAVSIVTGGRVRVEHECCRAVFTN
jgi:hypothetical protein